MVALHRSRQVPARWQRGTALALAALLILTVAADPLPVLWRYGDDPALAARLIHENSWPFHFCDIAAVLCAIALVGQRPRLAELGYLWGMAGTVQGLITPNLFFDWHTPEFWGFFLQHGGVPIAAVTLAFGMKLPPTKGAVKRAICWGVVYLIGAGLANVTLAKSFVGCHPNYGFVCAKPQTGSLLDLMGPWPWYLLGLVGLALIFFNLLCLPWRAAHRRAASTTHDKLAQPDQAD